MIPMPCEKTDEPDHEAIDGCACADHRIIALPLLTKDEELPASRGGVEQDQPG